MNRCGEDVTFYFIQTMPMEEKRRDMGWAVDVKAIPYVVLYYEDENRAKELIEKSDVVLLGWTEGLIADIEKERLGSGKLTFRISERIYREGQWKAISPKGLINKYKEHFIYRDKPVYLLCTGAYVASDFEIIKSYPGKKLKWGYFPDASVRGADDNGEEADQGMNLKRRFHLLWAGRLIDLKHPEFAVKIASELRSSGCDFDMDIVGDGPLMGSLKNMVSDNGLEGVVRLAGGKRPAEVLEYMAKADIFLFTSNYLEGWGAVVNEAMQSGCAVVASQEAGSVPFLIKDSFNGLIYRNGSYDDFRSKVRYLFEHVKEIEVMGSKARETIENKWNAENAAMQLVRFCSEYLKGKKPIPAPDGPMSVAEIIKAPGAIRTLQEKNHLE